MPASPERLRRALQRVTTAAQRELLAAAAAAPQQAEPWRATLFAVAPLVVSEYAPAAATLGLDWFDEIRDEADTTGIYTSTARLNVTDEYVAESVARTTEAFREAERVTREDFDALAATMLSDLEREIGRQVSRGLWDTVTENAADDPDAVGWRRYAKSGACKFCQMCAARGAVYTQATARFAGHKSCSCVAGPAYDPDAPRADVYQYLANSKNRTPKQNADLREYLNENYPDAPG